LHSEQALGVAPPNEMRISCKRPEKTYVPLQRTSRANCMPTDLRELIARLDATAWVDVAKVRREIAAVVSEVRTRKGVPHFEVHEPRVRGRSTGSGGGGILRRL
jgi:hypothetical protein